MEDAPVEHLERVVRVPSQATKVCFIIAGVFVVLAAYLAFEPLRAIVQNGTSWGCGTAFSAPSDAFGSGLCGSINQVQAYRSIAALCAALVVAGGGYLLLSTTKTVKRAVERDEF